jgi:hypothetical protein
MALSRELARFGLDVGLCDQFLMNREVWTYSINNLNT